jgi:glucose-1-phosphate thymidylyltransferase
MNLRGVLVFEDVRRDDCRQRPEHVHAVEHIANRPIAHHVLDTLRAAGVEDILVVSSVEVAAEIEDCLSGWRDPASPPIRHIVENGPVDLPSALSLAAPHVGDAPCLVHTAGGLLGEPLAPVVAQLRDDAPDVTVFVYQGAAGNGHLSPATQEMLHLAEMDPEHAALGLAGVWLFGPGGIGRVAASSWQASCEVDLTSVAATVCAGAGRFNVLPAETWASYSGDALDLLDLNRLALDTLHADTRRPCNHGNRIEGRVWIHEQALVRSSVIVGPTVIGPGARVTEAYVGPYTSVGAGAQIEGAEIERSIISSGASILHIGGRIVSSVVGRDARVFRDFSLPRAMRLRVGDGTEVALS